MNFNTMRKKIRLTERNLSKIVKRVVLEAKEHKRELELRNKLDDIFFGYDESNITSDQGERGYLSKEYRLKRNISPKQRVERIQQVISDLENYVNDLKQEIGAEEEYTKNPTYDEIWKDIEEM
jgi:hypothetical protein